MEKLHKKIEKMKDKQEIQLKEAESLLSDFVLQYNYSRTKKYVSLTFGKEFNNADEVVYVYQSLQHIEGIMTL